MMKAEELDQDDKKLAVFHEAGHATVAAVKGSGFRWARIDRVEPPPTNLVENKTWKGKTGVSPGCPATAVAGLVAEEIAKDPHADPFDVADLWVSSIDATS
jgi:hypothetical protein